MLDFLPPTLLLERPELFLSLFPPWLDPKIATHAAFSVSCYSSPSLFLLRECETPNPSLLFSIHLPLTSFAQPRKQGSKQAELLPSSVKKSYSKRIDSPLSSLASYFLIGASSLSLSLGFSSSSHPYASSQSPFFPLESTHSKAAPRTRIRANRALLFSVFLLQPSPASSRFPLLGLVFLGIPSR